MWARVVAALAALVLCSGCGSTPSAEVTAISPSASATTPDAAMVEYRNVIDVDFRSISHAFDRPLCGSRNQCLEWVSQTRAATEILITDMEQHQAPPVLADLAMKARAAADEFVTQLDSAATAINALSSNYQAVANALTFHDLDLAVATLDCWPKQPVNPGNEGDYTCA
jgi:hypothetical protein